MLEEFSEDLEELQIANIFPQAIPLSAPASAQPVSALWISSGTNYTFTIPCDATLITAEVMG